MLGTRNALLLKQQEQWRSDKTALEGAKSALMGQLGKLQDRLSLASTKMKENERLKNDQRAIQGELTETQDSVKTVKNRLQETQKQLDSLRTKHKSL